MGNRTPSEVLTSTLLDSEVAFDREGVGVADRFRRNECDAAGSVDVRRGRADGAPWAMRLLRHASSSAWLRTFVSAPP